MDSHLLRNIVEAALLAAGRSLSIKDLESLFAEGEAPAVSDFEIALAAIGVDCTDRGYELKHTASGYRFQVRERLSPWISRLWEEKPQRYSRALLETLALIAYRQPITRGDIEEIRGVSVSSQIIKTLQEREWVRVVGHRDVPGRPALYATTRQFLDYFNLRSLEELPALGELKDLSELGGDLSLDLEPSPNEPDSNRPPADEQGDSLTDLDLIPSNVVQLNPATRGEDSLDTDHE